MTKPTGKRTGGNSQRSPRGGMSFRLEKISEKQTKTRKQQTDSERSASSRGE